MEVSNASKNVAKRLLGKKDFGKPNVPGKTGFNAVADKAGAEYGSPEAGKKVAGSVFAKMRAK